MGELDREMLLGYLMNALEDDEMALVQRELLRCPRVRERLAELEKEISPLAVLYGSVEPPSGLANRTCTNIWSLADWESAEEGQEVDPASVPSPHFDSTSPEHGVWNQEKTRGLEEILAVSPRAAIDETGETKRLVRRTTRSRQSIKVAPKTEKTPVCHRRSRLFDLAASVTVGVLIAVIAFPALQYARYRVETMITEGKLRKLNQHYSPVADDSYIAASQEDIPSTVSLNQSGWQEVNPSRLPFLLVGDHSSLNISGPSDSSEMSANSFGDFESISGSIPLQADSTLIRNKLSSPGLSSTAMFSPVNPNTFSEPMLMTDVQMGSQAGHASTVQAAYGQNIIFRNGRVFFRVLPVFVPPTPMAAGGPGQ